MAKLLLQEGMRSAAMDTYRRSAFLMPVVDHHRVGRASDLPADVSRAFSDGIQGALAAGSGGERAALHKELGQLAYLRGDLPTAAQEYELGLKAARTESMAGIMAFVLGIVKKEQGKLPEAIGYLERATKNPLNR